MSDTKIGTIRQTSGSFERWCGDDSQLWVEWESIDTRQLVIHRRTRAASYHVTEAGGIARMLRHAAEGWLESEHAVPFEGQARAEGRLAYFEDLEWFHGGPELPAGFVPWDLVMEIVDTEQLGWGPVLLPSVPTPWGAPLNDLIIIGREDCGPLADLIKEALHWLESR